MGERFWFFTDPGFLAAQSPAKAFGPAGVQGAEDVFRVTHWHDATADAPAVAVCDGIVCAQPDGPDTLTLILKPSQTPPFEAPVVRYFIYKGVKRASLLNGNAVLAETDSTANELTRAVAKVWFEQNATLAGSQAGLGLDRDANYPAGSTPKIFTDADPIERLFAYPHPDFQLLPISGGDVIGSFKADCGFEIVLHRLGYRPKLGFARSADNVISVPSIAATNGGSAWAADDAAWFAHWHAKEQVLAFLDPAAFFGGFVQARLWKGPGSSATKVKGSDIYDELLATFANRNAAWLDIRNNYGFSYNLFGLHGGSIRFVEPGDSTNSNDLDFRAGGWPLLRLAAADVPGSRKHGLHRTLLRLPAGLATRPAALISKGFVKRLGAPRPLERAPPVALDSADPSWLTPVRIGFAAATDGGQGVLAASYTRVNLYERVFGATPAPAPLNVAGGSYLDGVFRPTDLVLDKDFIGQGLRFDIYPEEVLVDLEESEGPTYAALVGIAQEAGRITLFAFPACFLANRRGPGGQQPLPGWADGTRPDADNFLKFLTTNSPFTDVTKQAVTPQGGGGDIDTLIVRHEPSIHYNPATDTNRLEDYCLIVLPAADHQALVAQLAADTGADASLPRFLTVAATTQAIDTTRNLSYREAALQGSGFAASGGKAALHVTPLTQKVYEYADV